jgi:hypothetical protein
MKKLSLFLLLAVMITAGCLPPSGEPPAIISFDAEPPTVAAGESSTLKWEVSGATKISIDQGIGNVALSGSRAVMPSATTVYTLTATDAAGVSATATAQVIVTGVPSPPASLPSVNSFTANPPTIMPGGSATLSWNVSNVTSVTIDNGVGTFASSGSTLVSPAATTIYTLTATNAAGSTTAMAQVTVSGTPLPPGGLPVVNYFMANPPIISAGSSTTLSWDVSNATSVTIEPGVGSVGLTGTALVSPATNTNYTLTASNSVAFYSLTITVMITGGVDATPPSVPALLSPASGVVLPQKTVPWSFDWSDSSDAESGIMQYQLQVYRVVSSPFIDVNTLSSDYSQVVEVAYPYISGWKWRVRAQNNVGLWSDWSAERTFDVEPRVFYDFVDKAQSAAIWKNGVFTDLGWGIVQNDGFARYHINQMLDDGNIYPKVLETHPQWVSNGSIEGMYPMVTVPAGAKFIAKVGFVSGATGTDGVLFRLTWKESGSPATVSLGGKSVTYGGPIDSFEANLSPYAGKTGQFGLKVEAGASSGQDWAAWAEAKIVY